MFPPTLIYVSSNASSNHFKTISKTEKNLRLRVISEKYTAR